MTGNVPNHMLSLYLTKKQLIQYLQHIDNKKTITHLATLPYLLNFQFLYLISKFRLFLRLHSNIYQIQFTFH